jgi:hypothetical protein
MRSWLWTYKTLRLRRIPPYTSGVPNEGEPTPVETTYRLTEAGDRRVTEDGQPRVTEE